MDCVLLCSKYSMPHMNTSDIFIISVPCLKVKKKKKKTPLIFNVILMHDANVLRPPPWTWCFVHWRGGPVPDTHSDCLTRTRTGRGGNNVKKSPVDSGCVHLVHLAMNCTAFLLRWGPALVALNLHHAVVHWKRAWTLSSETEGALYSWKHLFLSLPV